MLLLNWLNLDPTSGNWKDAIQGVKSPIHIRSLLIRLVSTLLRNRDWEKRSDTVPLFEPSHRYQVGDLLALPIIDSQKVRPPTWEVASVRAVENAHNPLQGDFQVLTLEIQGREEFKAAGISSAPPFPFSLPESPEDQEMLAGEIVDRYFSQLKEKLIETIEDGVFEGRIQYDQILIGMPELFDERSKQIIKDQFDRHGDGALFITSESIFENLISYGWSCDLDRATALFSLNLCLQGMGYHDLGNSQWTTPERFEMLLCPIKRYIDVPRIRTRITAEEEELETIVLPEEEQKQAADLEDELVEEIEVASEEWLPPADPIDLGYLKFLHLLEGYLPVSRNVSRAFPPDQDLYLAHIEIVQGEPFTFILRRKIGVLQAMDKEAFRLKLTRDLNIWAGTRLWLKYVAPSSYRIFPKPIHPPREVMAKNLYLDLHTNRLQVELIPMKMEYEGDEHLYKSELRLTDLEALWREAEQRGLSILDCAKEAFLQLARLDPQGRVHYKDLFNAVFFGYRMCSPHTIPALLYEYACFVSQGNGYFTYDPSMGNRRRQVRRRPRPSAQQPRPYSTQEPTSDIWAHLRKSVGKEFKTLAWQSGFKLVDVGENSIRIRTSSSNERKIERHKIEAAWNHLRQKGVITRTEIRDQYSDYNPAYIVAILADLPGVRIASREPIRLTYQPLGAPESTADQTVADEKPARWPEGLITQVPDLWKEFQSNLELHDRVSGWIRAYLHEPYSLEGAALGVNREVILYLRDDAHQRIRKLLNGDRIRLLTEEEFNQQIFLYGYITVETTTGINPIHYFKTFIQYWKDQIRLKNKPDLPYVFPKDVTDFLQRAVIATTGNQTWGSATRVWAPMINATSEERRKLLHDTLLTLIDMNQPAVIRLEKVIQSANGFGIDLISGILHILHPSTEILYNERSIDALKKLGFQWVEKWHSIAAYQSYRDFCLRLRDEFGFRSLTDVDYFMYFISDDRIPDQLPAELPEASVEGSSDQSSPEQVSDAQEAAQSTEEPGGGAIELSETQSATEEDEVTPEGIQPEPRVSSIRPAESPSEPGAEPSKKSEIIELEEPSRNIPMGKRTGLHVIEICKMVFSQLRNTSNNLRKGIYQLKLLVFRRFNQR